MRWLLLLSVVAFVAAQESKPIVRVTQGILHGSWQLSTKGRAYASFQGVPYARPPVGKYRFREPQQLKPWQGVWDATAPLSECLQYDPFANATTGSEDCLYLNVHSPRLSAGASLPVLVFIHGGAFMYGAGHLYNPAHIMDRDMVVVTLNYRLGPLGFLSSGDEMIPGNAGLKDQAMALDWVRHNIMMFGGNPHSVTLTGCSAGGASVHYHYLSPMSKGNFDRGIAFSGAAFAPWTFATKPAEKAKTLAAIVGCPSTTTREMADCLRFRPAVMIVRAQIEMMDWKIHLFTPFTPTMETAHTKSPFLTHYPYHAALAGAMYKVPLITSVTSEEGLYPAASYQTDPSILPELESRWEHLASNIFCYNDTLPSSQRAAVASKIKQRYLGSKPVSQETFANLVQALGDRHFVADVGRLAQIHALRSGQPVYVYRYSYRAQISLSKLMAQNDNNYGVSHADDVFRIFSFPMLGSDAPEDLKMTEKLLDMVYSFATHGNPQIGHTWLQVTPGSPDINYLEISSPTQFEMKTSSDFGMKSFWDSLGFIENENYHVGVRDEL